MFPRFMSFSDIYGDNSADNSGYSPESEIVKKAYAELEFAVEKRKCDERKRDIQNTDDKPANISGIGQAKKYQRSKQNRHAFNYRIYDRYRPCRYVESFYTKGCK